MEAAAPARARIEDAKRWLGGGALVLAPLCNWTAALLEPRSTQTTGAEVLAVVASHSGRLLASAMLDTVGTVLFVPAVLAMLHLLAPRSFKLALAGGALAITGLFGFMAVHAVDMTLVEYVKGGADAGEMAALYDRVQENAGIAMVTAMFLVGQVFGFLLLSVGLFVTASVPRWLPPFTWAFLAWDVGLGIAGIDPQVAGAIDPHMLGFIGSAALGLLVLRQDPAAWRRADPVGLATLSPGPAPSSA